MLKEPKKVPKEPKVVTFCDGRIDAKVRCAEVKDQSVD
jgi:hypothetical protein